MIFKTKYCLVHLAALSARVIKNNSQTGAAAATTIITPYEHQSWKTGRTSKFGFLKHSDDNGQIYQVSQGRVPNIIIRAVVITAKAQKPGGRIIIVSCKCN